MIWLACQVMIGHHRTWKRAEGNSCATAVPHSADRRGVVLVHSANTRASIVMSANTQDVGDISKVPASVANPHALFQSCHVVLPV